jgi:hypothetical protein
LLKEKKWFRWPADETLVIVLESSCVCESACV